MSRKKQNARPRGRSPRDADLRKGSLDPLPLHELASRFHCCPRPQARVKSSPESHPTPGASIMNEDRRPRQDGEAAFRPGDRVRVVDATFEGLEGEVADPDGRARRDGFVWVVLPLFGRDAPVELETWQIPPA